jgi:hypothetical protein
LSADTDSVSGRIRVRQRSPLEWLGAGLVAAVVGLLFLLLPGGAPAAPHWSNGPTRTDISNVNCQSSIFGSPYLESEIGAFLGQYVDGGIGSPAVGEVFDIHLVVSTLGNECAGTRPKLEIALPPGVRPALGSVGIRCYISSSPSQPFGQVSTFEGCPDSLSIGTTFHPAVGAWYSLNPRPGSPAAPLWPLPQGATLEIQVPVVANRRMSGIADTSGCVCAVASIETVNGTSAPENAFAFSGSGPRFGPYVNLFVFPRKPGSNGKAKPRPRLLMPARVSASALRSKRLWVRVAGLRRGDRVQVRLKGGRRLVAGAKGTARGGVLRLRLLPGRNAKTRRYLRRGTVLTAYAQVTRSGKSGLSPRKKIRLK